MAALGRISPGKAVDGLRRSQKPAHKGGREKVSANLLHFEKRIGTPETLLKRQERLNNDVRFLLDHMESWRQSHPNRWVAVYNGELVAVEDTQERLFRVLAEKHVPLAQAVIDFVTEERVSYLL